ncbi:MAG: type II secretion system protein [Phycisphaerales bacterium]|jgi:type II secretory pathway pseudopilin PulG
MSRKKRFGKKGGFTIVELLTVMSVIIILIGLLVPALNKVKQYAKEVKQRAQFHSIDVAMELFETENDGYPDSGEEGPDGVAYCGAMKLAEAMVGQDLLGFHRDSVFRADLRDASGTDTLYTTPSGPTPPATSGQSRMGPYLQLENANATRLVPYDPGAPLNEEPGIYDSLSNFTTPAFMDELFVLCDVYTRQMPNTGYKVGMPILYYKANRSGTCNPTIGNSHDRDDEDNIYDYKDNDDLVDEGVPWSTISNQEHPMDADVAEGADDNGEGVEETFYWSIWNSKISLADGRPYRLDSYILLSAGWDGLYGTRDDIYNFQK